MDNLGNDYCIYKNGEIRWCNAKSLTFDEINQWNSGICQMNSGYDPKSVDKSYTGKKQW